MVLSEVGQRDHLYRAHYVYAPVGLRVGTSSRRSPARVGSGDATEVWGAGNSGISRPRRERRLPDLASISTVLRNRWERQRLRAAYGRNSP